MIAEQDQIIEDFIQVAQLAHVQVALAEVWYESVPAPHQRPRKLPLGSQAVYAFLLGDRCLKVGKAGPKTQARFTSQHYGMHAPSTLAKSILTNRQWLAEMLPAERCNEVEDIDEATVGAWIQRNTSRLHVFLPTATGALALSLLEAFVQCRLKPMFEGEVAAVASLE